tara:strand:+ start:7908 stop:9164 length:1257 start_codon:yes stop_codon:yes gene_type:complete
MPTIYDVIHGDIRINDEDLKFIDNIWMKRLKRVKQLGVLDHVFPCASHSRFEHSLGVYHLAGIYIDLLEKHNSSDCMLFTPMEVRCVKLAALFHDLGHGPFSHLFDTSIINSLNVPEIYKHHEGRSQMIVDKIFEGCAPHEFSEVDITLIKTIINPPPEMVIIDNGIKKYVGVEKPYLYQIVNNKITGLDVDKLDYIQRDTYHIGLDCTFSPSRIFNKSKICPTLKHIIYRDSLEYNIFNLYHIRYRLHRNIYNHPAVKLIELMLADALKLSDVDFADMDTFVSLDDSIYNKILFDVKGGHSKDILTRIENRDLYTMLFIKSHNYNAILRSEGTSYNESLHKDIEITLGKTGAKRVYQALETRQAFMIDLKFDLCNNYESPLKNFIFYNSSTSNIQKNLVRRLETQVYSENIVMIYEH